MTPLVVLLAATWAGLPNLDFAAGDLSRWEGAGFALVARPGANLASSADRPGQPRTAILHRTFVLPRDAVVIHFRAALVRPAGVAVGDTLDVVLEAAGREFLPRQVRDGDRWKPAPTLRPGEHDYSWDVSRHAGRRVRIAVVDQDARPGCHVVCGGFTLVGRDQLNARRFADDLGKVVKAGKLDQPRRLDSAHFLALSNADDAFTRARLADGEAIYAQFFDHFRRKGFAVRPPAEKLMVAIFRTQAGFEAYLGGRQSSTVTGVYHLPTNRLVVYDFASNRAFTDARRRGAKEVRRAGSDLERERRLVDFSRWQRDSRDDANTSTIMHEVAHQLSFNSGLLNRHGDVPVWLAEGLAVYCEPTVNGAWQGIGEPNRHRAAALAQVVRDRGNFLPLRQLVASDDWLRKATRVEPVLLGYAQSGALFRLLMEERPRQLRAYLEAIHDRRTAEHRLADFALAFGDLGRLERRYLEYLRELGKRAARP